MSFAASLAADKAAAHGFGLVGTRNTSSSSMALGFFARSVARRGLVALCLAQSPEYVAPHGAAAALFGTNPLAIGIPSVDGSPPLVLDMATSSFSWWGVMEAATAGEALPEGVAQDAAGQPTTDPARVLAGGSLLPAAGPKGSGLGLCIELLAGAMVGAAVADKAAARSWGNLVVAVDPALLGDAAEFKERVAGVLAAVKALPPAVPGRPVLLPGERGDALAASRLERGVVPMEPKLWGELQAMAAAAFAAGGGAAASPPPPCDADGMCAVVARHQPSGDGAAAAAARAAAAAAGGVAPVRASSDQTEAHTSRHSGGGLRLATRLVHPSFKLDDPYGATVAPLYQTATFAQPSATTGGAYDYTRSGNPTRSLLEAQVAELEGGARGFAFTSGMAALTAVTRLVPRGGRVLAGDDIYGGTSRLLSRVLPRQGIAVSNVDMTDLDAVRAALTPDVALVMLESPTNPRLRITDIRRVVALAAELVPKAVVCVDNSMLSPFLCRPLDLGAHISMVSATKFLAGHSDLMAGVLAVRDERIAGEIAFTQNAEGTALAPFDCWLTLRGVKTMALRQAQAQRSAVALAAFLSTHPLVTRVNFPGLPAHPGASLHASQSSGPGSILSFETRSLEVSAAVVEACALFKITVSFGGPASLISLPCFMSHASIPAVVRAARGLPDNLVRISAGIEDTDDLLDDLRHALDVAAAVERRAAGGGGEEGAEALRARLGEQHLESVH